MENLSQQLLIKLSEDSAKLREDVAYIKRVVPSIEEQTKKTNGRVNRLEAWKEDADKVIETVNKTTIIANPKNVQVGHKPEELKKTLDKFAIVVGAISAVGAGLVKFIQELITK